MVVVGHGRPPARASQGRSAAWLRSRYSTALDEPERRKLEAFNRGEERVDLEYAVMPGAVEHVQQWQAVLAEMDAYCRDEQLLTLATPREIAELQAWVLQEFVRQLDGGDPTPWAGSVD
jgi:glycine/D-amino acid oxidase-like deaminating enzyme